MSWVGLCSSSRRSESSFFALFGFHRFSELVLGLFLQKGVDQVLQDLVRRWNLLIDEVIVVQFVDAFKFGALLNLGRVEGIQDIFCRDRRHTCNHFVPFKIILGKVVVSDLKLHQVLQSVHSNGDLWHLEVVKDYPSQLASVQHLVVHLLLIRVPNRCSSLQIARHNSPKC